MEKILQLDLRINLVREVHCGCFKKTPSLRRLLLAGNFLNLTNPCMWEGLDHIQELDLGWNEITSVNDAFTNIADTLRKLDLRHNTNITKVTHNQKTKQQT